MEYQLFEYFENTGLLQMLDTVKGTSVTMGNLEPGSTHSYIVQPISYVEIADNVSPENSVKAACGSKIDSENGSKFTDVPADAYYAKAVEWAVGKGITSGTSATTFSPQNICNRGQMVTFLWRVSGSPAPAQSHCPFTDVSPNAYYFNVVMWAVENNITSGTSSTTFSPNNPVNRGQAVTFLYRTAGSPAVKNSVPFRDVRADDYFADAVVWAAEQNITAGTSATTFGPSDNCTRAQTVTFLYRFSADTPSSMKLYDDGEMKYWLYTPAETQGNMPLIVYLHGTTGKGDDPELLLNIEEFPKYLAEGALGEAPAYVLIPQLSASKRDWVTAKETVVSLIRKVAADHPIDNSNISLTGFSMGGADVWNIAASYPGLFRCIAPCSGGARFTESTLSALSNMKIWTFVGTADTVVKPQPTIDFMEELALRNPSVRITQFEGAAHTEVPALVYLSDDFDLVRWLVGG